MALFLAVVLALLSAVAGGLLRAGAMPAPRADWLGHAALHHGALMICCFMGTVIGVERAVALKLGLAWGVPVLSAFAGPAFVLGWQEVGTGLVLLASAGFIAVNGVVVKRQPAPHAYLLLGSALAWLAGNLMLAWGASAPAVLPWWFAFVVMTIAAERLEMTRLMRRRPGAHSSLYLVLTAMVVGAAASAAVPVAGGMLFGVSLTLLAAWLLTFDIARRTLWATRLPRYMAVCLLGGYVWLALGGVAWCATALGLPVRDAALHALGLGFIVSMMMGHAPVILPAVARVKLQFGLVFYLPLVVLHLSLVARLGLGLLDPDWHAHGSLLNALAIALFAATVAGAALVWHRRHGATRAEEPLR